MSEYARSTARPLYDNEVDKDGMSQYVYRIELQYPVRQLGMHTMPGRKRVIPMATYHRLMCGLTYQAELPANQRATLNVTRAVVGDWYQWSYFNER